MPSQKEKSMTDSEMKLYQSEEDGKLIVYQTENKKDIEVYVAENTIWLTQSQIADLFVTTPQNVTIHIRNIFKDRELEKASTCKDFLQVQQEGNRQVSRVRQFYNLDIILSVGYRVKSVAATRFRIWATSVLHEFLLNGNIVHYRLNQLENKVLEHDNQIKTLVRTALPPTQGVFFDGQIFDAYVFAADLVKSAKESIVLIDNYVDESVLLLLSKRNVNVHARIITRKISPVLATDLAKHNQQYPPITIEESSRYHDRFLIIDATVYHIGASLKDLGKKLFAFSRLDIPTEMLVP